MARFKYAAQPFRELIAEIQALESKAHLIGATITAHKLNEAKNQAGWDLDAHLKTVSLKDAK